MTTETIDTDVPQNGGIILIPLGGISEVERDQFQFSAAETSEITDTDILVQGGVVFIPIGGLKESGTEDQFQFMKTEAAELDDSEYLVQTGVILVPILGIESEEGPLGIMQSVEPVLEFIESHGDHIAFWSDEFEF